MKPKQMMLFAVAISCGLVAMIGAQQILSGNKAPEQEMVEILVAKMDIDPGIPLDKFNVSMRKWPKETVPDGAITSEEQWAEHALKIHVSPNMPVLVPYLGAKGAMGITSMIPEGMTLVTLPVDSAMLHSGLLRPGSFVSISCTIDREQPNNRPKTTQVKTVLKRVKVIAVGDKMAGTDVATKEPNPGKVENVSFVTFPQQAKLLLLAKAVSNSRIHLTILPESDKSTDDLQDLDDDALAKRCSELYGDKSLELKEPEQKALTETRDNEPRGKSGFSEYLKQQAVVSEVTDLGKAPTRATWKIQIYRRDTPEIHEVELPPEPEAAEPVKEPVIGEDWASPILKFFTRKPSVRQSVEETQSTRSDDSPAELPVEKSAAKSAETIRQ